MSKKKGLFLTCDRCGAWNFQEYIGKDSQNVSYTDVSYSETPPDWKTIIGVGDVCPKCWQDYVDMLERYKKRPPRVKED